MSGVVTRLRATVSAVLTSETMSETGLARWATCLGGGDRLGSEDRTGTDDRLGGDERLEGVASASGVGWRPTPSSSSGAPSRARGSLDPPNMMLPRLEKEKPAMKSSSMRLSVGMRTASGE